MWIPDTLFGVGLRHPGSWILAIEGSVGTAVGGDAANLFRNKLGRAPDGDVGRATVPFAVMLFTFASMRASRGSCCRRVPSRVMRAARVIETEARAPARPQEISRGQEFRASSPRAVRSESE